MRSAVVKSPRMVGRFKQTAQRLKGGFTLVEIMIVVSVIALLAIIALPSLLQARQRTRRAKFVAALRVARDACELYAAEHNAYPLDQYPGIPPPELQNYFDGKFDWTALTPIGGQWDWDYKTPLGFTAGVSVDDPDQTAEEMAGIDSLIDDGNLLTGAFRQVRPTIYSYIIEK